MPKVRSFIIFDFETGGLKSNTHAATEIADLEGRRTPIYAYAAALILLLLA